MNRCCVHNAAVAEGNAQESVLAWPALAQPSLRFGCSIEDVFGSSPSSSAVQVANRNNDLAGFLAVMQPGAWSHAQDMLIDVHARRSCCTPTTMRHTSWSGEMAEAKS